MSIDYEVEVSAECDKCGRTVDADDCTVLCGKCAPTVTRDPGGQYCRPVEIKGVYTCLNTRRDYEWSGELPPFCPRCGHMIRM